MSPGKLVTAVLLGIVLSGCATVEPMSFEESLQTQLATRNDIRVWDEELRYRVEFQYANTARQKLESAELEIPPNTNIGIMVPFAIWEFGRGNDLGGGLAVADWLNSGLTKESRYRHYYNRGLVYMGVPNTHYFTFDERAGTATPDDVHAAWDEAFALFQSVHNRSGDCHVYGFREDYQYARTYPKDVLGKYKDILWLCKHPLFENEQYKVLVMAYANPFPGVRVIAGTVTQCYIDPPRGQKDLDFRNCGMRQANQQRSFLPDSRFGWMELITTPIPETPYLYEVVAIRGDEVARLPAPETTEDYQESLKERPY